jgi:hypothetical protein
MYLLNKFFFLICHCVQFIIVFNLSQGIIQPLIYFSKCEWWVCTYAIIIHLVKQHKRLQKNEMELTTFVSTIPGEAQTTLMPASAGILL